MKLARSPPPPAPDHQLFHPLTHQLFKEEAMSILISGTTLEALKISAQIVLEEYKGYLLWIIPQPQYNGFRAGGILLDGSNDQFSKFTSEMDEETFENAIQEARAFVDSILLQKAGEPEEIYLRPLR